MTRVPTRLQGLAILLAVVGVAAVLAVSAGAVRPPPGEPLLRGGALSARTCDSPVAIVEPVPVTSGTLHGCPERFDGRRVRVVGEAVGDLLGRGPRRWVQLNDDAYATAGPLSVHGQTLGTNSGVAVLLPDGQDPTVLGGPDRWGDLVEVVGVFHTTAAEDQGGPAVIAEEMWVLQTGRSVDELPLGALPAATCSVLLAAGAVWGVVGVRRRRTPS
ncbi:hypothetical protein [Euzebya rosea]|uniref:hypothetical protein n=1 Tax=Euzebya rosea TaxID=2052804 RepID=UPI000D3E474D|nr:hypothetical protein [Euzebya rosea]